MKKVEKVSIGRYAFTLEEDASNELAAYIEALKNHYSGNADCGEIVDAFEDRMAELLLERHDGEHIVTCADIDAIKAQIGAPESFGDAQVSSEKKAGTENGAAEEWWKYNSKKKMYRPRNGRIVGGVAAAMAKTFNMDVTLMRVIWFVAGMLGIWISDQFFDGAVAFVCLAYIVLWICIPSATQRQEAAATDRAPERSEFWRITGNVFRLGFGGILSLTGICGIACGVAAICGLSIMDVGSMLAEISDDFVSDMTPEMIAAFSMIAVKVLLAVSYFIPFIILLYEGLKVCFEFQSPKWHPGLILTLIWFLTIIATGIVMACALIPTL